MSISFWCNAADNESLGYDNVTKSIRYVHDVFTGNDGDSPIFEANNKVGNFKFEGAKVFINFRGSLGLEFLPLLTNKTLTDASKLGIEGKVHSGALSSALSLKAPIVTKLDDYCSKNDLTMDELQVYLGGYSRGSTLATTLAPALLSQTQVQHIRCITYGTLNVFDSTAASNYDNLIGKDNYLGFIAEEDLSRSYFASFSSVGNTTVFSANDNSPSYCERVREQAYSHLIKPWGVWGISAVNITINQWEAHMPETYLDAIPNLYGKVKKT